MNNLKLGFLTGNPEVAVEIEILRENFRMETQILVVISSPESNTTLYGRNAKVTANQIKFVLNNWLKVSQKCMYSTSMQSKQKYTEKILKKMCN